MNVRAKEYRRLLVDTLEAAGMTRQLLEDPSVSILDLERLRSGLPDKVRVRSERAAEGNRNRIRYHSGGRVLSVE